jgi:hypothetical protein
MDRMRFGVRRRVQLLRSQDRSREPFQRTS